MSFGFFSRPMSLQHASRNSTVVSPVVMPGLSAGASATSISSRLRSYLTTGVCSFSDMARHGICSVASITRVTTGKSTDVNRYREES
jgi:hypothetical protein